MNSNIFNTEVIFAENWLQEISTIKSKVLIIDSKILLLHTEFLIPMSLKTKFYKFNASESNKSLSEVTKLLEFFQRSNVNRSTTVICIGGGITTDIGAFAASIYKRGCHLILIPTTLLGMVDAAIGGKTAINFNGLKNGIGTFYPAEKVIISTVFLTTLPKLEYQTGMVEVIKMSFIQSSKRINNFRLKSDIKKTIKEAVYTKIQLCKMDLYDNSSRRLLNLGHTFGHVLESISHFEISHGTAVGIGIRAAALYSLRKKYITDTEYNYILTKLDINNIPSIIPVRFKLELQENGETILKQDKKANDKINLILFKKKLELFVKSTTRSDEIIKVLLEFIDGKA